MNDYLITSCNGEECPLKNKCNRFDLYTPKGFNSFNISPAKHYLDIEQKLGNEKARQLLMNIINSPQSKFFKCKFFKPQNNE
jgi:hypothetical protein